MVFPNKSNFIKKKNASFWAKKSGKHYRILKTKRGYTVKLGKKK